LDLVEFIQRRQKNIKMSKAQSGSNNPNFGKVLSDKTKLKISKAKGITIFV
jgi:hypothetical protein